MRRRAKTVAAARPDLDMMVLEYTCRDDSAFAAMGKHLKEVRWRVAAMGTPPLDIRLRVEKQPMMDPDIGLTCDGAKLYPTGAGDKGKLKEDFEHKWPFRGEAPDLKKRDHFEVKPKAMGDNWFPAGAICQKKDGLFEADVWLPDGAGGAKQVHLPSVDKEDIRERASKQALAIPYRNVVLSVPKSDPVHETALTLVDTGGAECITNSFARPTPPAGPEVESMPRTQPIVFDVARDRSTVTTGVPHSVLASYMATEVYAVDHDASSKVKMSWTIMLGPYATHTITIEKKHATQGAQATSSAAGGLFGGAMKQVTDMAEVKVLQQSPVVSLSVDGRLLVEAASDDFEADWETDKSPSVDVEGGWLCKFRFLGERSALFKVFETNASGVTLDTTDLVEGLRPDQVKISKACTVAISDLADVTTAMLSIDGVDYMNMKHYRPLEGEAAVTCDAQVLEMQYGICVPTKVRDVAPLALIQEKLQAGGEKLQSVLKENWEKSQPGLAAFQGRLAGLQEGMGNFFKSGGAGGSGEANGSSPARAEKKGFALC